jgi:hypothetical protein
MIPKPAKSSASASSRPGGRESFAIEKGVPIPPIVHPDHHATKYPWPVMELADSFFAPADAVKFSTLRTGISSANKRYAPKKWAVRRVEGGARVWRVR